MKKKKKEAQLPQQEKDINYWKNNCEEDYMTTPISVLRYISELEKLVPQQEISDEEIEAAALTFAEEESYGVLSTDLWKGYLFGAKRMRDRLKQNL